MRSSHWTIKLLLTAIAAAAGVIPNSAVLAQSPLKVVTSATDYASLAELIGGEQVEVMSLTNGSDNIHNIVATPRKMLDLGHADLFIHTGLDLELWVPDIVKGSRNPRIQEGQPGNVDCSKGIKLKDVPQQLTRKKGDIHIYGNPHYMLDPINHILVARTIRDAMKAARPGQAGYFDSRYQQFEQDMKKKIADWLGKMKPYAGAKIVGFHPMFSYFAERFKLEIIGNIEEKPGIPPDPNHIVQLTAQMKQAGVKIILVNTWADRQPADAIARATGAQVLIFPEWVRGVPKATDVFAAFDYRIKSIAAVLDQRAAEADEKK